MNRTVVLDPRTKKIVSDTGSIHEGSGRSYRYQPEKKETVTIKTQEPKKVSSVSSSVGEPQKVDLYYELGNENKQFYKNQNNYASDAKVLNNPVPNPTSINPNVNNLVEDAKRRARGGGVLKNLYEQSKDILAKNIAQQTAKEMQIYNDPVGAFVNTQQKFVKAAGASQVSTNLYHNNLIAQSQANVVESQLKGKDILPYQSSGTDITLVRTKTEDELLDMSFDVGVERAANRRIFDIGVESDLKAQSMWQKESERAQRRIDNYTEQLQRRIDKGQISVDVAIQLQKKYSDELNANINEKINNELGRNADKQWSMFLGKLETAQKKREPRELLNTFGLSFADTALLVGGTMALGAGVGAGARALGMGVKASGAITNAGRLISNVPTGIFVGDMLANTIIDLHKGDYRAAKQSAAGALGSFAGGYTAVYLGSNLFLAGKNRAMKEEIERAKVKSTSFNADIETVIKKYKLSPEQAEFLRNNYDTNVEIGFGKTTINPEPPKKDGSSKGGGGGGSTPSFDLTELTIGTGTGSGGSANTGSVSFITGKVGAKKVNSMSVGRGYGTMNELIGQYYQSKLIGDLQPGFKKVDLITGRVIDVPVKFKVKSNSDTLTGFEINKVESETKLKRMKETESDLLFNKVDILNIESSSKTRKLDSSGKLLSSGESSLFDFNPRKEPFKALEYRKPQSKEFVENLINSKSELPTLSVTKMKSKTKAIEYKTTTNKPFITDFGSFESSAGGIAAGSKLTFGVTRGRSIVKGKPKKSKPFQEESILDLIKPKTHKSFKFKKEQKAIDEETPSYVGAGDKGGTYSQYLYGSGYGVNHGGGYKVKVTELGLDSGLIFNDAGTALKTVAYEYSKVRQPLRIKEPQILSGNTNIRYANKQYENNLTGFKTFTNVITGSKFAEEEKEEEDTKTKVPVRTSSGSSFKESSIFNEKLEEKQEQQLKTNYKFKSRLQKQNPKHNFDFDFKFEPDIIKGFKWDTSEDESDYEYGFIPQAKVKGKFISLSKPVSKRKAASIGSTFIDSTLSRTFRVVPTKIKVKKEKSLFSGFGNAFKFRDYQVRQGKKIGIPNTFIEKSKYALEKSETSIIKPLARRGQRRKRMRMGLF